MTYVLHGRYEPKPVFKVVKLADFGGAASLYTRPHRMKRYGTPGYLAPETTLGYIPYYAESMPDTNACAQYSHKTDIWAVGITLCKLAYKNPFSANRAMDATTIQSHMELKALFTDNDFRRARKYVPLAFRHDILEGIARMHTMEDASVISANVHAVISGIRISHPGLWEMVSRMLQLDPRKRADMWDILSDPYFDDVPTWVKTGMPGATPIHRMTYNPITLQLATADTRGILMAASMPRRGEYSQYGTTNWMAQHFEICGSIMRNAIIGEYSCPAFVARAMWLCWQWLANGGGDRVTPLTAAEVCTHARALCSIAYCVTKQSSVNHRMHPSSEAPGAVTKAITRILEMLDYDICVCSAVDFFAVEFPAFMCHASFIDDMIILTTMIMRNWELLMAYTQWQIYSFCHDMIAAHTYATPQFNANVTDTMADAIDKALEKYPESAPLAEDVPRLRQIVHNYTAIRWPNKVMN
jgi:hypothetical protein